ncbi:MAG: cell division protein ZapA [Flavobacteriales bacterium]|nr:cell division protein ZapA [Flavobacteriales bacterium]
MSELSIKVKIAGRAYPLTIKREEEEAIRKAAKEVDKIIATFQENYAVSDKQDLLAMTALQLATKNKAPNHEPEQDIKEHLNEIDALLDKHLQ